MFYFVCSTEKRIRPHPMISNNAQDLNGNPFQGICNDDLNKEECSFDGNDCCSFRNVNSQASLNVTAQTQWYDDNNVWHKSCKTCECKDPCKEFLNSDEFKETSEFKKLKCDINNYSRGQIGNDICDPCNNFPQCDYDGNDCCPKFRDDKCFKDAPADSESKCQCKSGTHVFYILYAIRRRKYVYAG